MSERSYRLDLQYDGGKFHGWQSQSGVLTVERVLAEAYENFLGTPAKVAGSGRTDAGVHARHQVAQLQADTRLEPRSIHLGVKPHIPEGLSIFRVVEMGPEWRPRPAFRREYRYFLWKNEEPPLFLRPFSVGCRFPLDREAMQRVGDLIPGERDFSAFQAAGCTASHPIRRVESVEVLDREDFWEFRVIGNAFLRQMVRIIVGTLVEAGRGAMAPERVEEILNRKDRSLAGPTMGARGLFLWKIAIAEEEEQLQIPKTVWEMGI